MARELEITRREHADRKTAEYREALAEKQDKRLKPRIDWTRTQCAPGEGILDTDLYRTAFSGEGEAGEMAKEE